MSILIPDSITVGDLVAEAISECGAIGVGQSPSGQDTQAGWARLQLMLQRWERQRWKVYQLVTLLKTSTGAQSYSVGPGQFFDTGTGSVRPDKIEAAFLRQFNGGTTETKGDFIFPDFKTPDFLDSLPAQGGNPVDWPLELLLSMQDYSRIGLKNLVSWTECVFYDPGWPFGTVWPWPIPTSGIYGIGLVFRAQLPVSFPTLATKVILPLEYHSALIYNLAMQMRSYFSIPTFPGDVLPTLARDSMAVITASNVKISRLQTPTALRRPGIYNIFTDRNY